MDISHRFECRFTEADSLFYEQNRTAIIVALTAINMAGGVPELIRLFLLTTPTTSVFNLDLKNPDTDPNYKQKLLRAIYSLSFFDKEGFNVITRESLQRLLGDEMMQLSEEDQDRLLEIVQRFHSVFEMNSIPLREDARHEVRTKEENVYGVGADTFLRTFAMGCSPFLSLIAHSCTPNVRTVAVENKIVVYVTRPIARGNQIFMNYGAESHLTGTQERQEFLRRNFGFDCRCDACRLHFPLLRDMQRLDNRFIVPNFGAWHQSIGKASRNFIANNLYIYRNFRTDHLFEVTVADYYTSWLLHFLASEPRRLDASYDSRHGKFYVCFVFSITIIVYASFVFLFFWYFFGDNSKEM